MLHHTAHPTPALLARHPPPHALSTLSLHDALPILKISDEAKCEKTPVSCKCLHFPNCRAKHSTSPVAIPSRFIPVSIFKWKGTCFLPPRRVAARLSNANCSQRWITAVRSCSTSRDSSPGTKLVSTRIGFRTPAWRTAIPSSVQVTPNQSEPAFSSAFATSGPPWP